MMKQERAKLIEHMLCEVEADLEQKKRSNAFIESIREVFDLKQTLSDKQLEALRKFYANV